MRDRALFVLLLHAGATLFMTGLVWFVQVVHYPLYARVGIEDFARYELDHTRRTNWIVAPVMGVEALTAWLLLLVRPTGVAAGGVWLAAGLLAVVWLSTFLLQVPRHTELCRGFDARAHARRAAASASTPRTGGRGRESPPRPSRPASSPTRSPARWASS